MKKIASILLLLSMLLSLAACGGGASLETEEEILPTKTDSGIVKLDVLPNEKRVYEPLTWEKINSIPVANSSMSTDELRKICLDYFHLQMTFGWTPSADWDVTVGRDDEYKVGLVYGGIPYVSSTCGNVYKWMCFYDEKTGVMDIPSVGKGEDVQKILGSQCSGTAYAAWSRVSNSFTWDGTSDINPAHNIILIGPYTYDTSIVDFYEARLHTKEDIANVNGKDIMFASYAALQPADGLFFYHETAGHVIMCYKNEVVRDESGAIDGQKSRILYYGQTASTINLTQENKIHMERQRDVQVQFSYNELYDRGYLPFGIKELHGLDPVEKAVAGCTAPAGSVTPDQLKEAKVTSNYAISVIETRVYENGTGKVLFEKKAPVTDWPYLHIEEELLGKFSSTELKKYADGKNTVEISIRVNTGELLQAYTGILTA